MTSSRRSSALAERSSALLPRRRRIASLALLLALAGGCGAQSLSTDTGNPPVVGKGLHLTATASGVLVSGEPGTVPAGARVDVINTASAQTASTTAAADGSFEVEIAGAATDEYRVYAGNGEQSWSTHLMSAGTSASETGIAGRIFLLESAQGYTPVPGTRLRLAFQADTLSFSAGCNGFSGSYSLCGDRLCISEGGGTEIGCAPELAAQDSWFGSFFFEASPRLSLSGAALTLEGTSATLQLLDRELADPDRPLTGRVWKIDTFFQGGAASSSPSTLPPTLQLSADGTLHVFTTCNEADATYTRSGQTLTLSTVAYTDRACGPSGNGSVEQSVQQVIRAGDLSVQIDANHLTLMRGTTGLGATTD
jgi:heat shock protein HslJ